ncbi:hypothetical protein DPX16_8993 [Anabarilius grahami]|uniref:Uncharacterized protein n=1 Tax=Anabarilius grahami TaxID=495550 RepID=A0A3N0XCV6_ANAGA|nr:hypothetical protein DPX16_8993 [Anabarilius grahami]
MNRSSSRPRAAPFLTRSHGSCSPPKSASQKHSSSHTQQPEERSLSDVVTSNTDVTAIQQHILVSPGEAKRKYNSLRLPNELTCKPLIAAAVSPQHTRGYKHQAQMQTPPPSGRVSNENGASP